MNKEDFLKNFANQFDDTDVNEIVFETNFRDLEEWSSLVALAVLNMIGKKYGVILKPDEMKQTTTIQELFDLVNSKIV